LIPYSPLFRNPHLATIAAHFWPSGLDERRFPVERWTCPTELGVKVLIETQRPPAPRPEELVLVHGLEGSSRSRYMKSMARAALEAGFMVHRFNMRSCGGSEALSSTGYHSGMTGDLLALLRRRGSGPFFLAGFSLGGNVILKLAGELGERACGWIGGVCAVSTPIDLGACVRRLEESQNRLYHRRFVRRMKERTLRLNPAAEGLENVRTLRQFDDRITSPAFGFRDSSHYYDSQSCWRFLEGLRIPAVLIHAKDDPVIPSEIFDRPEVRRNPCLELLAVERGGHVGFISRRRPWFWLGPVILDWISAHSVRQPEKT